MIREFVGTSYALATARRWADLVEFFRLTAILVTLPVAIITAGKPVDKKD